MINVVIDTNILVSALWTPGGNPAKILSMVVMGNISPCYDHGILFEYREVLSRPKLNFASAKTEEILELIEYYGYSVIAKESGIAFTDEADRKFYDVSVACGAVLITGNLKHFPAERFIMTPVAFLRRYSNE
jgi:putative PIN family toxin of toxin-antitoxin system